MAMPKRLKPLIDEWCQRHSRCWICLSPRMLELHHIERRSQGTKRKDLLHDPCNWFRACKDCHDSTLASPCHALQLAYKLLRDPVCFDLDKWLWIGDRSDTDELRAPNRVTPGEILDELQKILLED